MPGFDLLQNLRSALQHHLAGRLPQAEALYRTILAHEPRSPDALHHLGLIALQVGQTDAALELIAQARSLAPDDPAIHANLGETHRRRGDLAAAEQCFRQALALQPEHFDALHNLGLTLQAADQPSAAIACLRRAVELRSAFAVGWYNLGLALKKDWQTDEALACFTRALALDPNLAEAHVEQGGVLMSRGLLDEAIACFRRALIARPGDAGAHDNLVLALHYRAGDDAARINEELARWREAQAAPLAQFIQPTTNDRSPDRPLRVGYVSADFRDHPIARFMRPLLAAHDRRALEVYCYSTGPADKTTQDIRRHADVWRDQRGRSIHEMAEAIRRDRIDVLVDLGLHTGGNNLRVFALKPAPLQVTYLAYPGSSGLDTMDYRLTDVHLDPADAGGLSCEEPLRLPNSYWCYEPPAKAPEVTPLPLLTEGNVTFGCLNNHCKFTPETISAWSRLLQIVERSHLILNAMPGEHRALLQRQFAASQIDPQRLHFVHRLSMVHYFETYAKIDVALDPYPFPGGTTTCDALWMGVPVVTCKGPMPVSRGGVSLLTNVGLTGLIADSMDDYIKVASSLAGDRERLMQLRTTLRDRVKNSPLSNPAGCARDLEAAYRSIWRRWCKA